MNTARAIVVTLMLLLSLQSVATNTGECFMDHDANLSTSAMQAEHDHCGDTPAAAPETSATHEGECNAECSACIAISAVSTGNLPAGTLYSAATPLPAAKHLHTGPFIDLPLIPPIAA